jgi:hypothetical protein
LVLAEYNPAQQNASMHIQTVLASASEAKDEDAYFVYRNMGRKGLCKGGNRPVAALAAPDVVANARF